MKVRSRNCGGLRKAQLYCCRRHDIRSRAYFGDQEDEADGTLFEKRCDKACIHESVTDTDDYMVGLIDVNSGIYILTLVHVLLLGTCIPRQYQQGSECPGWLPQVDARHHIELDARPSAPGSQVQEAPHPSDRTQGGEWTGSLPRKLLKQNQ